MVKITGDTHGEQLRFHQLAADMKAGDTLMVAGDFGYIYKDDSYENIFLNKMEELDINICFCDGNHENFDALEKYEEMLWNGGRVHRIRRNVFHLMRGQVFEIEGSKYFVMGGAYSIDRAMRKPGISWWSRELPRDGEYKTAVESLSRHDHSVDYIISHTAPREIIRLMGYTPQFKEGELTGFLEWVMYNTQYKKWFFGHLHEDREVGKKHRALFFDEIIIEEGLCKAVK